MADSVTMVLLWFSIVACGLVAGLYFTFSAFAMRALARIDVPAGIAAMNSINVEIQRSLFMPLFVGSSLSSLALAVIGLLRWGVPGAAAAMAGGLIYFAGMFVVTMVCNVPRNSALAKSNPASAADAALWALYLREWTFWNHVRTLASTAALVLFVIALIAG
ncbi:putative membrane protein [Sphingopyxis panaciterrae]|uniref:anthrone oxygenase family protein n=1 Tax=Sphingopyxis panaciterrae TaxID=363841 RepID=UPI00142173A9|nr:anthrone oxygenase family protein [Sphingopyxis panaciterrae]NIJ37991.1 putative membrane protein [Sphingopyxis panaciterrae]